MSVHINFEDAKKINVILSPKWGLGGCLIIPCLKSFYVALRMQRALKFFLSHNWDIKAY